MSSPEKRWNPELVAELRNMRNATTDAACARHYAVTPQRIRQVMAKEARRLAREGMDYWDAMRACGFNR